MLSLRISVVLIALAGLATYTVEVYGFAIAHSAPLLVLAALISPGVLLAFFDWGTSNYWLPVSLCVVLNAVYYFIALLVWKRRVSRKNTGSASQ